MGRFALAQGWYKVYLGEELRDPIGTMASIGLVMMGVLARRTSASVHGAYAARARRQRRIACARRYEVPW